MKLLTFTIINNDKAKSTWTHAYNGSRYLTTGNNSNLTGFTIPSTAKEILMIVGEYIPEHGNGVSNYNNFTTVLPISYYTLRFYVTINLDSTNFVQTTIYFESLSELKMVNVYLGTGNIKGITVHLWYR